MTPTAEITVTRLLTRKNALGQSQIRRHAEPVLPAAGEALLRIERVALTTNNITYAAFGDAMQYWQFFPTGDDAFGHMPVWGFAEVLASDVSGLAVGERFYGYFPIASHLRVQPTRVTERGFYDAAPHRQSLTSAYNHYVRCSSDAAYEPQFQDQQILLRPLFITSFMLADFLQDNAFFGATRLVVSSASSKTAYGTAFCLQDQPGIELVALTSAGNRSFVDRLGCYARCVSYDELESLPAEVPTVYVDFSGDTALRARVHQHVGEALRHDCYAGSAQNTDFLSEADLPGPKPQFYFAPVQIKKRNSDWGHAEVNRRFNAAQADFIRHVGSGAPPWLRVAEHAGFDAAAQLITQLHAGRMAPDLGHVVVMPA